MKVLVTGANGFIGKNLVAELQYKENVEILSCTRETTEEQLEQYCRECKFVFDLAGVNRPKEEVEFTEGNVTFVNTILELLKKNHNECPVMYASSTQVALSNAYAASKRAGEELIRKYGRETGTKTYIYRFPNVFGKWCRPNYNSAVATFCYNTANGLPLRIDNEATQLRLVYIDDVVQELILALEDKAHRDENGICYVPKVYERTLGEIAGLLEEYKKSRTSLDIPYTAKDSFEKKLYSTYLSYLPIQSFSYPLVMHEDQRGSFTEILRSLERGQFSVNISKPGITKGNHWHNTKNEKYVVVSGTALIRFRKHGTREIIEYKVSGEKLEVVDIPVGYTHSIANIGESDLVTFMWCNECFDPEVPDTYFEEVDIDNE